MAMKKKFLGLAMAAMVAIPATGVYATGTASNNVNYQKVEGQTPDAQEVGSTISVNGEVLKGDNTSGKIQVEIPTAMAFTVDKDSNITGPEYEVRNLGSDNIDIFVTSFINDNTSAKGNNLTIHPEDEITNANNTSTPENKKLDRSHVSLKLHGYADDAATAVDLGKINRGDKSGNKVATVAPDKNVPQIIKLTGTAGNKADADGIDKNGTSGDFKLSFKISKGQL